MKVTAFEYYQFVFKMCVPLPRLDSCFLTKLPANNIRNLEMKTEFAATLWNKCKILSIGNE